MFECCSQSNNVSRGAFFIGGTAFSAGAPADACWALHFNEMAHGSGRPRQALEHLEGEGDEDWLRSLPEVEGLIRRWHRYDGQAVALSVTVVADGVVHGRAVQR